VLQAKCYSGWKRRATALRPHRLGGDASPTGIRPDSRGRGRGRRVAEIDNESYDLNVVA
jgi:hypothetical protein